MKTPNILNANKPAPERDAHVFEKNLVSYRPHESDFEGTQSLLDALIECNEFLHAASSWKKVVSMVLEKICLATHASRATILKNITSASHTETGTTTQSIMLYKWAAPSAMSQIDTLEVLDFSHTHLENWENTLQQGSALFADVADLSASTHLLLKKNNIETIIIAPIFVNKSWWGNIVIERFQTCDQHHAKTLGALITIARSLGDAILKEAAEKQLHHANIAFDSVAEGIMIIDVNAKIIAINNGYSDITGFSEHEVLGSTPQALQADRHDLWRILLNEGKWRGECTNQRKNGEPYQEWLTITVVKNQAGNIVNYVGVFADITENKRAQNRLHELVNHDPLTGLPNRRLLNELIEHAVKRADREQHQIALLFVDLDRFKAVNDTLGHQVGDKLLYEASRRISLSMRDSDVVARLGGDEFLVMMDMISKPEDATLVAQKIIHALQIEFIIDGKEIFIGASIGISICPKDGNDVDGLIKAADIAMYQVKNRGKNNYCFYSEDLSKNAVERFTMENQLRKALERDQFVIYYQPQVSLITGEIIGAEALIRWNHPELGMVSPAKFIPVAEETGLIVQIGEWVLRKTALQAKCWVEEGYSLQWVSINVSGIQILRSNFADTVYGVLIETECDPLLLELEITESTVMQNTEYVIDTFSRIKQFGVRLAIDDFGTGYSSLSNLKRLPLDKIKIDQSFVRDLPEDLDDAAITNAIYAMARSLGFNVIAEGVETMAQAEFLKNMGCEEAQGYLYSKPVTAQDLTALLVTQKQMGNADEE